ncbi:hypothetical protein MBLNU457_7053t1 [Dothideomycetes sp. NU457]
MATPRLTFLWPFLFKPAATSIRQQTARGARRGVQSTTRKRQQAATQRYGTANEPPPHLIAGKSALPATVKDSAGNQKDTKALTKTNGNGKTGRPKKEKVAKEVPKDEPQEQEEQMVADHTLSEASKTEQDAAAPQPAEILAEVIDGSESSPVPPAPQSPQLPPGNALETVLNMPSSDKDGKAQAPMFQEPATSTKSKSIGDNSPPHISAPLYVHHFDTYGLVKRLEEGGWNQESAITTMKAVRLILAENMDLARAALVSKSNVENETYLFRAACSELLTEINTKRKAEAERSRTDRAQLQHEVDILGQRLTQEGGTLKDDLKGMFDDRKMAIRNEQRSMESKIQELNYRITVTLNSDSRSDVEGVRWIITKRAIGALATCVLMVIASLKYASTMMQIQEEERKRFAAMGGQQGGQGGQGGMQSQRDGGHVHQSQDPMQRQENLGAGEMLVMEKGDNPAFVSLG